MTDVSVLGTGLMGAAVARTLATSGRTVTVWNRTAERARGLEGDGITVATSASEALHASPVVIPLVSGSETVRELLAAALPEGPVGDVVNLTSSTPAEADDLSAWAAAAGVAYLDGAIFGYPTDIGTPTLRIVYSGDRSVYDRNETVLLTLAGASKFLGSAPGLASALDVTMLIPASASLVACMEGIAQGVAHGLSIDDLVELFASIMTNRARLLEAFRPQLASDDHRTADATISTWKAGVASVVAAAERSGVRSRMAEAVVATFDDAETAGWGDAGLTAIYRHRLTGGRS